jgi:predicted DNA-binding transcriptional regulator AlpA
METAFITTSNLATRWGLTYSAIYKWRLRGYGPKFHKMGNRVVYRLEEVEEFENSKRCRSTSEYPLKVAKDAVASKKKEDPEKRSLGEVPSLLKKRK